MRKKLALLISALLLVVGLIPAAAAKPGFELTPQDRTLGNPKAKVVLIEYAALTCPHCAAFNEEVFPALKKNYIDTGKVLYVFRLFPRAREDGMGEKIARCLPREKYFATIDLIFRNQEKWDYEFGVQDGPAQLARLGQQAGLSPQQTAKCLADTADDARINRQAAESEARYGLTGTPTFVINGKAQESGGLSYEDLARLLDNARTKR